MLKWLYKQAYSPKRKMSYYLNTEKIKQKAELLNERDRKAGFDSDWQPVEGLYWINEIVKFTKTSPIDLRPSGIPIKLFINKKTGEYRSFHINQFEEEYGTTTTSN